jgi:multiple antibiotic resistance protein
MADFWLNAFVTLLVTIDPVGLAPIFVVLTAGRSRANRRRSAIRATVTAAAILVAFALVGEKVIGALGISVPAFRISGGLLLFWIAFEMVFSRREERKASEATAEEHNDVAIFPLAIPLTAGPGAISATILLASQARTAAGLAGLVAIILVILGLCLVAFLLSERIDGMLGLTGRTITSRLLGVILAALSVQFVADGVMALMGR